MKIFSLKFLFFLFTALPISVYSAFSQGDPGYEKQLWAMASFNWKLDDRWVYNQDAGYQHSYETPTFTRIYVRSQINRQLTGVVSLHGGLNFLYKFNELENNAIELRPWIGSKLRWPYFWRINFVHYLRFEQRFEHTMDVNNWENNFRVRYKVSSNISFNNASIVDNTFYGVLAYEFFSSSFGDDIRFTTASTHRFDVGLGFKQNIKNSYEAALVFLNGLSADNRYYTLSSGVLFLKYKRYINWN